MIRNTCMGERSQKYSMSLLILSEPVGQGQKHQKRGKLFLNYTENICNGTYLISTYIYNTSLKLSVIQKG